MKPNILFLFPDQWRGDWFALSEAGEKLGIPTLRSLASEGTVCQSAFTPSPLCAPARACIASGMEYPAYGVVNNGQNFPADGRTVYQQLRDRGYHVMGCGKFDLHKASYDWGRDGSHMMQEWGFSDGIDNEGKVDGVVSYEKGEVGPYMDFLEKRDKAAVHTDDFAKRGKYGTFPTELTGEEYCDNWITGNALDLLDRAPKGKPWFLQINFTGPHDPFDITQEMSRIHRETPFPAPFGSISKEIDHLAIRRNYAAMMENIDRNIEKLLSHPRLKGDRDKTVIIFASDHGDMLGDHGFYEKHLPHNGSSHVPLFFTGAGIDKGRQVNDPVSLIDLPGTFLDLAGMDGEILPNSRSLLPLFREGRCSRDIVTSGLYVEGNPMRQWRMALNGQYKYIRWFDGSEALYDRKDYREEKNLIDEFPEEVRALKLQVQGLAR